MSSPLQRNSYQGSPPRLWITLRLASPDGTSREFKMVVDTGCPVTFVIAAEDLPEFSHGENALMNTNFGVFQAEWFHLAMPELGLDCLMVGYASDEAADTVRLDHPDFAGLVGLPLLRLLEYGGNGDEF